MPLFVPILEVIVVFVDQSDQLMTMLDLQEV